MADEDKTEEPTGKKLEEARKEGQIGRSMDLNSGAILLIGFLSLYLYGRRFTDRSIGLFHDTFSMISTFQPNEASILSLISWMVQETIMLIWPILAILLVAGMSISIAQVGLNFTLKPLQPNFAKVFSPSNIKTVFGANAWMEAGKGIVKVILVGFVAFRVFRDRLDEILPLMDMDVLASCMVVLSICAEIIVKVAILMLILGFADLWWQKRRTHNKLKMTKQEVKDEAKNTNGDPKVIAKRRKAMIEMHNRFMMKEVPKATVVITNPTHLSIAIRYRRGEDHVPTVVAKGADLIAMRIRELAKENDVPVVENKPLARAMYDSVEVGQGIPPEFFAGVAEVLAFVFSVGEKRSA